MLYRRIKRIIPIFAAAMVFFTTAADIYAAGSAGGSYAGAYGCAVENEALEITVLTDEDTKPATPSSNTGNNTINAGTSSNKNSSDNNRNSSDSNKNASNDTSDQNKESSNTLVNDNGNTAYSENDFVNEDEAHQPTTTNQFIMVGGDWITPVAYAGSTINVVLPVVNMSNVMLTDVIVTPVVAGNTEDWPFEIDTSGYTQTIPDLPGKGNGQNDMDRRRELTWTFRVRKNVLNGYYKVPYNVIYYTSEGYETTTLTTWVRAVGLEGAGNKDDGGSGISVPRVIITGFDTTPAEVYAGDTFDLTLHLQNTSKRTAVSNMQIDLTTPTAGKDTESTYEAFLPTSGSNTLYVDRIGAGGSADVNIEMTAKADLSQKPYQIAVNMAYEDQNYQAYTASSNVSIPIKQEARFEIGEIEAMPDNLTVGQQSNIMFSIFNTGKTVLYNVQVKFEGEGISGGDSFIGKLDSGATGNVDAMINADAPGGGENAVKATVYYEDEAGNVKTSEKYFTLYINDFVEEDMGYMEDFPEEPKGPGKLLILFIVIIILAIIITVVIIILKKKKKKAMKDLEEGLDEDEIDDGYDDGYEDGHEESYEENPEENPGDRYEESYEESPEEEYVTEGEYEDGEYEDNGYDPDDILTEETDPDAIEPDEDR